MPAHTPEAPAVPALAAQPAAPGPITVSRVIKATAEYFRVTAPELVSDSRTQPLTRRRQIAMHVAHKVTGRSLPFIGSRFGGRDHTTILNGVRAVQRLLDSGDRETVVAVGAIKKRLQATTVGMLDDYKRLAEAAGAVFTLSRAGEWLVKDRHGVTIVRGVLSKAEAVRLYCEDKDLTPATPECVLARIKQEYRPFDMMPEFQEGFDAWQKTSAFRPDPYDGGVKTQAWDRGANAAMLYARALAHLKATRDKPDEAEPGWLFRLLTGRC
jgi:hypothetical protein